jgi:hypothetical protein
VRKMRRNQRKVAGAEPPQQVVERPSDAIRRCSAQRSQSWTPFVSGLSKTAFTSAMCAQVHRHGKCGVLGSDMETARGAGNDVWGSSVPFGLTRS